MATKDVGDATVVRAVAKARACGYAQWPQEILAAETGQPAKVCWRALERAARRGFIGYGASLRTAWATESGLVLIGRRPPG